MTIEQIDRLVRDANPVPDLKALEPLEPSDLLITQQRSGDMQTQDRVESGREPESLNRRLLIGVAAVVLLLIGALVIFLNREEAPVVDQAPVVTEAPKPAPDAAASEIATGFLEAYAAFDAGAAASYLSADADLSGLEGGQQAWRQGVAYWEAVGFKMLLSPCEQLNATPPGTTVRCTFDYHAIRSDEIGVGPFTGSWFDFTVVDGEIVSATMRFEFMSNGFSTQVWEPFAIWISQTYPEDGAIMYTNANYTLEQLTPESLELWDQHSREYVAVARESTGGESTP